MKFIIGVTVRCSCRHDSFLEFAPFNDTKVVVFLEVIESIYL